MKVILFREARMLSCLSILSAVTTLAAVPTLHSPVSFEPNQGQTDARVKFLARDQGVMIWFTLQGPVMSIPQKGGQAVVKMRFEGGRRAPEIEGEDRRGGASNYFIGSDPSAWRTDVPHFGKVRYRGVYPGVDVVFYANAREMEYDFVVAPGADPSKIRLAFEGAESLTESGGDLVVRAAGAEIRHRKPAIRQGDRNIGGHYALAGKRRARIVMDSYDPSKPLVIDPVLSYATLLGGNNGEQANGAAVDAQGNVIVVGYTTSANFPTASALYPAHPPQLYELPSQQGFVTKFLPSASGAASVVFSTFFASADGTNANAVALDKSGNIYITGGTYGDHGTIPLKNPFQSIFADDKDCGGSNVICKDAFVAELNAAGNQLLFSSLLGGSNWDEGFGIAVDGNQNIYVTGYTQSGSFPKVGPGQPYQYEFFGNSDGFLTMVGPGRTIVYSTFFGANGDTHFNAVAVDASGMVYAAGYTTAGQIPGTAGAFQTTLQGTQSAIVAKFNLTLTGTQALLYFTYLGGAGGTTAANGMALGSGGNIYLAGGTTSASFPVTAGAFDKTYVDLLNYGSGDGFVAGLNPQLQGQAQLAYSTLLGGSFDDVVSALAVDPAGHITVTGYTDSLDFPLTPDAVQSLGGYGVGPGFIGQDGFLARLDPSKSGASSLLYSTLLSGTVNTHLNGLAMDAAGYTVAVAGMTQSGDAPVTPGAFQSKFGGQFAAASGGFSDSSLGGDAYIAVFDFTKTGPAITLAENGAGLSALTPVTLSPGLIFTIKGTGLGPAIGAGAELDQATGLVANKVSGVQVLVDGVAVPLIYVSAAQINAVAPYELASKIGASVNIQTVYNGVLGNLWLATVAATAPAIFSFDDGSGQGAIRNQDQSVNGASNPASAGSIISIYATGEGQTNPAGMDGALATEPLSGIPVPKASASVTIGNINAPIQFIGTAPGGIAGFLQVNVTLPAGVATGSAVPVVLTVGGVASQKGLTMAIH